MATTVDKVRLEDECIKDCADDDVFRSKISRPRYDVFRVGKGRFLICDLDGQDSEEQGNVLPSGYDDDMSRWS